MQNRSSANSTFGSRFSQVSWVVKDIQSAEKFFQNVMGIKSFVKLENLRVQELDGTYYRKPGNYEFNLYMGYPGGSCGY
jgi:methylmalonyl-CoA/ethylmalonyl-CoA epimerase